jgi:uncharacterized protein YjdB
MGTFSSISSSGSTIFSGSWDDNTSNGRSIGFTFTYCGNNYTSFNINANGWINFGSSTSSSYTPISARTYAIAPLGKDIYRRATSGSGVVSQVTGSSPNRVLIIEWFNVCYYSSSSSGPLNFQIRLYETSNKIEFIYGAFTPSLSTNYYPQVGINGSSTSDYNNRTTTSNWSATTAGTSNSVQCTSNNSVKPANGLIFTWCPPVPTIGGTASICAGSTTTLTNSLSSGTWSSSNTSVATVTSGGVVSGVAAGTATISYMSACGNAATKIVTVNAVPSAISGGSTICTGNTITLTSSGVGTWSSSNSSVASVGATTGVVNGVTAGTATITYTVTAGGCFVTKPITVNTSPATTTGTNNICSGSVTALSNTTSGGTWSSSNTSVATVNSSGVVSGVAAGTPNISYTLSSGCSTVFQFTVNAMPAAISGATSVCETQSITLSNTSIGGTWSASGGATIGSTGVVTGTGAGSSIITYTMPGGCNTMHSVTVNALSPITGTPSMCIGYTTTLSDATPGGTWSSSVPSIAMVGTGSGVVTGLTLGTAIISYVITSTGCTETVSVAVTNPPTAYAVTGGGAYCSDGVGVLVGVSATNPGVIYQLYHSSSPLGSPAIGTGGTLTFGYFLTPGIYTVIANPGTACAVNMGGSAIVSIDSAPPVFSVSGDGPYCAGGLGSNVSLASSTVGVNYQLYNGSTPVGTPMIGTSTSLNFGYQTSAGTYTVVGTDVVTGCTSTMTGSSVVSVDPLPTSFTVTGGGAYCSGTGTSYHIGLSSSTSGIQYELYNGVSLIATVTGTGSVLDFGSFTAGGTYTVLATNTTTGCSSTMTGYATITVNALPAAYNVTGGGNYCSGGTGVSIGLNTSAAGISYQLRRGSTSVGSPVAGTGAPITFGLQTTSGTYTVRATNDITGCTSTMNGSAVVGVIANPAVYTVTGGGGYCAGGSGISIGVSSSAPGVTYELYNGGSVVGTAAGTGSAIGFGLKTAPGGYAVVATNSGGCTSNMSGSATISINPLPDNTFSATGGGNYCAGSSGVSIGLTGSQSGIDYRMMLAGTPVGATVAGTGSALPLGNATVTGTYTIVGTDPSTLCFSTMAGSVAVGIDPLPASYIVTGGGAFCPGTGGIPVGLSNSNTGISYQLYQSGSAIGSPFAGTGSAINMGLQASPGSYTVAATNTATGCSNNMAGSASVSLHTAPASYTVTGGGNYCAGSPGLHIGLSGSSVGNNYQLYNGSSMVGTAVAGTGSALDFGIKTVTGSYTVVATDVSTRCTSDMAGSVAISASPLPISQSVTGGGNYCAGGGGVSVGLLSSTPGVDYQLYLGGTATGSPVPGTGALLDFGLQTSAGIYTVAATDATTGCSNNMTGSANVSTLPVPAVHTITGGGNYCPGSAGVNIGLSGSAPGVQYQLYRGGSPVGAMISGTGLAIGWGMHTVPGIYTVSATDAVTSCTEAMSGTASVGINPPPAPHIVTGGGGYCTGGPGVNIDLDGSDIGINYQLYRGGIAVGSPVAGTGTSISFGALTTPGTYTAKAVDATTGCSSAMPGSSNIAIMPMPVLYTVTGGGSFCPGGTGVPVGLSSSAGGSAYQLYNGSTPVGASVTGTGGALDFGLQTSAGTYTAIALASGTTCAAVMTGSANIALDPVPNVYNTTGGGSFCAGGTGVHVGLDNSEAGVTYRLYSGASLIESIIGSGAVIDFGAQAAAGSYYVMAANTLGCESTMLGSVSVFAIPLPGSYSVTGGGNFCADGTGVHVGVSFSDPGITYQLYRGTTAASLAISGTGAPIGFGLQTIAGNYQVKATSIGTGCQNMMYGSADVVVDPLPVAYDVLGGGSYCAGGTGRNVELNGSVTGVSYQLYEGPSTVGTPLAGTGAPLDFGNQVAAGNYTVIAKDDVTSCTNAMNGSAVVSIVTLPAQYNVTGGGSYCDAGPGAHIGIDGSATGINYQLYEGSTAVSPPMAGTGSSLDFGSYLMAGTYNVIATDATSACVNTMSGSANVSIDARPNVYTVTGGGSYCPGGAGVPIGLSNSDAGVSYQSFMGTTASGLVVAGSGGAIDLGLRTTTGAYNIVATDDITGCTSTMSGAANVSTNTAPAVFAINGGGNYCAGSTGVHIGLGSSSTGVTYQLLLDGTPFGTPFTGTGSAIDFGLTTATGTYSAIATNLITGCASNMTGTTIVGISPSPAGFAVTGGGSYCPGGSGVTIGVVGSDAGINYRLYNGTTLVSVPVPGTGGPVDFGPQVVPGSYIVTAVDAATGCLSTMPGTASIAINPLPVSHLVVGGGSYCAGGAGVSIGIANTSVGVSYQLYNGTSPTGSPLNGTGFASGLGLQTAAGVYTVRATDTVTGCVNNMSGSASVSVIPASIPSVIIASSVGDTACSGTLITLTAIPVNGGSAPYYEWSVNGTGMGAGSSFTYLPTDADVVSVQMTSSIACALPLSISASKTITVGNTETPSVTITASPSFNVCEGTNVTYQATATFGGASPAYQWVRNGIVVASSSIYSYRPEHGDEIECIMTSSYSCRRIDDATSNKVIMRVDAPVPPTVSLVTSQPNITPGQSMTITAVINNGGTAPVCEWKINGNIVAGVTGVSLTRSNFANGDVVSCKVTASSACAGMSGSSSLTVYVYGVEVKGVSKLPADIRVIPNPNNGEFVVKGHIPSDNNLIRMDIIDLTGRVVYSNTITNTNGAISHRIQLNSDLANGIYLLTIYADGGTINIPVAISR